MHLHIIGDMCLLQADEFTDGSTPAEEHKLPSLDKEQPNSLITAEEDMDQMSPLEEILVKEASPEKLTSLSLSSEHPGVKDEYEGKTNVRRSFVSSLSYSLHSFIIEEQQTCLPAGTDNEPVRMELDEEDEDIKMEQSNPAIMIVVEEEEEEEEKEEEEEEEEDNEVMEGEDEIGAAVMMIFENKGEEEEEEEEEIEGD